MSSVKHLYVTFRHPSTLVPVEMKFGGGAKAPPPQKPVTMPDVQDAAVRKRQSEVLASLLKRRGRSSTLLSGRLGDQSPTATRSTLLGRGEG